MKLGADERYRGVARLRAAGIPIPLENHFSKKPDLLVESLEGSLALDLTMGSEYLLNVRISNNSYGNLMLEELRGRFLGHAWNLTFQGDPKEHDPERKTYPMLSGRCVPYESVLNHRLVDEIAAGTSIEGNLLASSITGKIPREYLHGDFVPLELILTDQYGRKHPSVIEVAVDRIATMAKPKLFSRVGRSLYGGFPRPPEFDHSLKARQTIDKKTAGEIAEEDSKLMKRLTALLQRPDVEAALEG